MTDSTSTPESPSRPFPLTAFLIPAAILLGALSVFPLLRAAGGLGFPFQLDREEGFLLNQAILLSRGDTLYPPIDRYPYLVGNYPPVYPAVYSLFVKCFGPSLPLGRLINLLAAVAILAGLAWSVASRTRRVVPAILAPCLFAATWDFNQWIAYARVDILALCLTLWGFIRFSAAPEKGGARGTALLLSLALLTRQTLLAAPIAAVLVLAFRRDWRSMRSLSLRMALYTGGAYGLLFLVTSGQAWSHLVTYNANPFHWDQVGVWTRHLWRFQRFILVLAPLTIICLTYLEKWERWGRDAEVSTAGDASDEASGDGAAGNDSAAPAAARPSAPAAARPYLQVPETIYLVLAFASILMVGKEGAASNYLLEFHMALALFLGVHVAAVRNLGDRPFRHHALGLLNALLFLGLSFHAVSLTHSLLWRRMLLSEPPPGATERLAGTEVLEAVEGVKGEVIVEEPIYAILSGHEVLFQPFILSELARQNLWDQTEFVGDLRSGRFEVLVTTADVFNEDQYFIAWTPEMRAAIRGTYRESGRIDHGPRWRYWVYRRPPRE